MQKISKYCCDEHIDTAFDDFLDEEGTFPLLESHQGESCSYCTNEGKYMLIRPIENNEHGKA